MVERLVSHSEQETSELARRLGLQLRPGHVVLLFGPLGVGKTAFVRGLAEGLEIGGDEVSSPTFTLVQEYRGRLPLYHVDLYRLEGPEVEDLGLEELGAGEGVVAVEWADRMPRPTAGAIEVRIVDGGGDTRELVITRPDSSAPLS
ncbi:MAG: tRNA (adenosine(37)-N6)-threonylcarbamoyltransferase complex ATPase subunit type 1 TsaE [Acidobacteria bacterium]|nr:tRNA (adenosine(37)-N6)-threonylcarbamoyltransferase complex ATPase subunit type 1 TsaE [Acidobacteriota bacterium]